MSRQHAALEAFVAQSARGAVSWPVYRYAPHGTPGDDWVRVGTLNTPEAAHAEAARLTLETGVLHGGGHPTLRAVVDAAAARFDARPAYRASIATQKELKTKPAQLSLF